jgi:hypothetical protein
MLVGTEAHKQSAARADELTVNGDHDAQSASRKLSPVIDVTATFGSDRVSINICLRPTRSAW